jgi:hypothetical protein
MTELLQKAIALIQELPPDEQDAIATRLLDELEDEMDGEAATRELIAIPGLLQRVQDSRSLLTSDYTDWRTLRPDV